MWLRRTLEEILVQLRRLLDISACAFQVVDFEAGTIHPAAAWFATDEVRAAMTPVLERRYDRERPGVTEAAIERGDALHIERFEEWEGATALRLRLEEELAPHDARLAWDWYQSSSFISCPVRTAGGRTLEDFRPRHLRVVGARDMGLDFEEQALLSLLRSWKIRQARAAA